MLQSDGYGLFAKLKVYDDQPHALWALLPHDQPREHQTLLCSQGSAAQAFTFTRGAFQAGGLVGVPAPVGHSSLSGCDLSIRSLAESAKKCTFHFSSLALLRNVHSGVHRDGNNHSGCRYRRFSGGELWCHEPVAGEVSPPGYSIAWHSA
eukprot:s10729_g3.t1